MKKTFTKMIAAGCLAFISTGAFAQSNQLSFGVDLGLPMGDFGDVASLLVGPSVGFELPVSDNIGITLQVGYLIVSVKDELSDLVDNMSAIPAQAGIKYYVSDNQDGVYIHGQLGIHSMSTKTAEFEIPGIGTVPSETVSSTNFSWGIGGGYQLPKLDIGLRYNSISPDSDAEGASASSYIGVRAAFLLNLGG